MGWEMLAEVSPVEYLEEQSKMSQVMQMHVYIVTAYICIRMCTIDIVHARYVGHLSSL